MIVQIGDNEQSIRRYLERKLDEMQNNGQEEHVAINSKIIKLNMNKILKTLTN